MFESSPADNYLVMDIKTIRKTRQTVIDQILKHCQFNDGDKVLEPSAGTGDLVDGLIKQNPTLTVDCVELNQESRNVLREKGYRIIGYDFFDVDPQPVYDYVIACPTYKDNIDTEHIIKMYEFIKTGGSVVSLTSPYWTVRNSERQRLFREWLSNKDYYMKMLDDFSFVENYDTQPSMIIVINKK